MQTVEPSILDRASDASAADSMVSARYYEGVGLETTALAIVRAYFAPGVRDAGRCCRNI